MRRGWIGSCDGDPALIISCASNRDSVQGEAWVDWGCDGDPGTLTSGKHLALESPGPLVELADGPERSALVAETHASRWIRDR